MVLFELHTPATLETLPCIKIRGKATQPQSPVLRSESGSEPFGLEVGMGGVSGVELRGWKRRSQQARSQ